MVGLYASARRLRTTIGYLWVVLTALGAASQYFWPVGDVWALVMMGSLLGLAIYLVAAFAVWVLRAGAQAELEAYGRDRSGVGGEL